MYTAHIFDQVIQRIGKDWMLISAQKPDGTVNTMTAAWGGVGALWNKPVAFAFIRPQRFTWKFVESADEFSLSFFDASYRDALALLGTESGRDGDKIAKAGLTVVRKGDVPFFREAEDVLICRKLFRTRLREEDFLIASLVDDHYPARDFHDVFVGEITERLQKSGEEHLSFPAVL